MDRKIDAAVEAGSLSEVDSAALESALDSIDTALSSSASESTSRLDPSEMKDRIDSLIDEQVSAGTLTEDQASALQSFFAQGPGGSVQSADASSDDGMRVDGMGGVGGPGRMGGPPPGPPPSESTEEDSDSSTVSTTDTSVTDQLDSMIAFLENLRASMSQSLYGSATSSTDSSNSGLLVDSLA